jgi:hypothetical protein
MVDDEVELPGQKPSNILEHDAVWVNRNGVIET